jgi:electron transport complex protein RnfG
MIVVLTALTGISGGLLAAVKTSTEVRIEEQILTFQKAPAIEEIFPGATNDPIMERFKLEAGDSSVQIFPAKLADGSRAIAFETKGKGGYGGDVGLMVGIKLDNDQIMAARVTTHSETPGLGARAKDDPKFVSQFADKPLDANLALKSDNGSIDAMSGATITSRAVTLAAIQAQKIYKNLKPEIIKQMQ